jgi:methionyl-tRNA formyltransferase
MSAPLRLGFAGSPAFAAAILARLIERQDVVVVYCQPARPRGRGRKLTPCPVEALARAHGIAVQTPRSLRNPEAAGALARFELDYLIVAAYGLILPPAILATPRGGCLNVHASLLPRWRGAAPIERALMAGDTRTGVSLMRMDEGLDTGPVLATSDCAIGADDTGGSLHTKLAALGADLLLDCLPAINALVPTPQPATGVTYATKLTTADSVIDWRDPATAIARKIRALTDRQPAFGQHQGERVRVLAATVTGGSAGAEPGTVLAYAASGLHIACGEGSLQVTRLQFSRGKGTPLAVAAAVNGYPDRFPVGSRFDGG